MILAAKTAIYGMRDKRMKIFVVEDDKVDFLDIKSLLSAYFVGCEICRIKSVDEFHAKKSQITSETLVILDNDIIGGEAWKDCLPSIPMDVRIILTSSSLKEEERGKIASERAGKVQSARKDMDFASSFLKALAKI